MAHDTEAANRASSPSTPSSPPTHEKLLIDLFEFNFNIQDLIRFHNLTPAQFLAFSEDKTVRRTLDAFEAFQQREQRILARQAQSSAAGHLSQSIMDAPNSIEARRAATALARLSSQMQPRPPHPPRPTRLNPSPAPGGGGAESSRRRGKSAARNETAQTEKVRTGSPTPPRAGACRPAETAPPRTPHLELAKL